MTTPSIIWAMSGKASICGANGFSPKSGRSEMSNNMAARKTLIGINTRMFIVAKKASFFRSSLKNGVFSAGRIRSTKKKITPKMMISKISKDLEFK